MGLLARVAWASMTAGILERSKAVSCLVTELGSAVGARSADTVFGGLAFPQRAFHLKSFPPLSARVLICQYLRAC